MSTFSPMGFERSRGLTLVELMVAIAVALILVAAVIQLFVGNKQAYRLQEGSAGLNENSRFARQQLEYALRMAGHWGGAAPQDTQPALVGEIAGRGCAGAPVYQAGSKVLLGIEGFDATTAAGTGTSSAAPPLDCELAEAGYRPGTDVLLVRYAGAERLCLPGQAQTDGSEGASEAACISNLQPDEGASPLLLRSRIGAGNSEIFRASDVDTLYGSAARTTNPTLLFASASGDEEGGANPDLTANHPFFYEVFFVTECGARQGDAPVDCEATSNPTPTLARLRLVGDTLLAEDLVEGVEALELTYGIDDNGDYVPDRFLGANAIRAQDSLGEDAESPTIGLWNRVTAVRVGMLVRNPQRDMALAGVARSTYRLPGREITVPEDDRQFPRKSVVFTVQARNSTRNQR